MKAQLTPIGQIKPNPENPRIIKNDKFLKLVESIKAFPKMLELRPIVVNDAMVVLGGNMRLKACIEAGLKKVWVVKASNLTQDEQHEFTIKDNLGYGEWDWDLLANEWDAEKLTDWGMDIPVFKENTSTEDDNFEIPEEIKTNIKLGDLIEIGRHRLLCGDSTDIKQVEKLMNGKKADMVFTDPPYSVNFTKKSKEVLKSKNYNEIANDNLSVKDTASKLWRPYFKNCFLVSKEDCSIYCTMPQGGDQMMMMMMMMNENWQIKHELIWVKESPVFSMGRLDYDYKHEPIAYGWKKKHNFYGKGEFTKSVWEIPRIENKLHPTMKPIRLISNAILNSSKEDNNIFDGFGGSGSTMVAAEQTNRNSFLIEIDIKYCQVIIDRMLKLNPELKVKVNGTKYVKTN